MVGANEHPNASPTEGTEVSGIAVAGLIYCGAVWWFAARVVLETVGHVIDREGELDVGCLEVALTGAAIVLAPVLLPLGPFLLLLHLVITRGRG